MKIVACVIFVLCLIDVIIVSGQLITSTPCAQFGTAPMPFFNKNLYKGTWFVHQNFDQPGLEPYNCYVSIRTPRPDGNHNVTETLYQPGQPTFHSTGWVIFNKPGYGQELYTQADHTDQTFQYQILSTDYFNYAMEWLCQQDTSNSRCYLFIMSRKAHVSTYTQSKIDAVLKKYHIPTTGLRTLNISVCPAEFFQNNSGSPGLLGGVLDGVVGTVTGLVNDVGALLGNILK